MATALTLPAVQPTAHERFKDHSRMVTSEALIVATLLHFALLLWFPAIRAQDVSFGAAELSVLDLPPEVEIPPPPQTIARPAAPVLSATADVNEDITIAPTTFEAQAASTLPPPPEARAGDPVELAKAPVFTPYTVSPELRNRDEVASALVRSYPAVYRESGIGGVSIFWFFIDENGTVIKTQLFRTSGYEQLDQAAAKVAGIMRFSPAMNRDRKVPVWVQLPITFTVR